MRWLSLIGAVTITACLFTSEPIDQLELSLALSGDRVLADSGLLIHVAAVNRGTRTVSIGWCPLGFELVPPADHSDQLYMPNVVCTTDAQMEIASGDSATLDYHVDFRPQWGSQRQWNQPQVTRWPAGRYEVTGYLRNDGQIVRRTAPASFDLVCSDPTWTEC